MMKRFLSFLEKVGLRMVKAMVGAAIKHSPRAQRALGRVVKTHIPSGLRSTRQFVQKNPRSTAGFTAFLILVILIGLAVQKYGLTIQERTLPSLWQFAGQIGNFLLWGLLWGWRAVLVLVPLLALIFIWRMYRKKHPTKKDSVRSAGSPPPPPDRRDWRQRLETWKENEFVILLGIAMLHFVIWIVWRDWWIQNIFSNGKVWGLHFALLVFALMIPSGKRKFHNTLGRMGVTLVLLLMLFVLFGRPRVSVDKRMLWLSPLYAVLIGTPEAKAAAEVATRNKQVVIVEAPVSEMSAPVLTPGYFEVWPEGPILVYLGKGRTETLDKDEKKSLDIGSVEQVQFQSRTSIPVKVTVIR